MVDDLIKLGLQHHRAGQLQEAKVVYEQALKLQPQHPDALHLTGLIALQSGDAGRAVTLIRQAIQQLPWNPGFHANLAQARLALGQFAEAHAAFRRAAELDPANPQFPVGAANCLAMQGQLAEAEQQLRGVVERHPGFALAQFNLAHAVREQGRLEESVGSYRRALELDPALADAHHGLGHVLHRLGQFEEAEQAFRRHLALQPDSVTGYSNLASVLMDRGRAAEAVAVCQQALARTPAAAELHLMLGNAFMHQGQLTHALAAYGQATALAPEHPRALFAHGSALHWTGDTAAGLPLLQRALELQPDLPDARYALSAVYLSAGDLQPGWNEYQWRTARRAFVIENPNLPLAETLPGSLAGKRICLLREQGLGDELFFLRFAAALKSRGTHITYRAHAKIAALLAHAPGLDRVIGQNDPLPSADATLLVGDLPRALGPLVSPPPSLRLAPLPGHTERARQQLAAFGPPPYLGLTWRAGTAPEQQRGTAWVLHKEVPLEKFGALLRETNGTLIALQRNPGAGEIGQISKLAGRPLHDLTALNEDLEAMLALLALLDDYVGVSNTNMHLAAAAGNTARVLVPCPAEWRWMNAGAESPWFPGFRVYRQDVDGEWGAALAQLAQDMQAKYGER